MRSHAGGGVQRVLFALSHLGSGKGNETLSRPLAIIVNRPRLQVKTRSVRERNSLQKSYAGEGQAGIYYVLSVSRGR